MDQLLEMFFLMIGRYPFESLIVSIILFMSGYYFGKSINQQQHVTNALRCINFNLSNLVKIFRLRKPGLVYVTLWQGDDGMLKFVLVLPEKGAPDVVQREVTVAVGANEPVLVTVDGDTVKTSVFEGEDGESVVGTLVDVDDAGNKSEAREFSFVLVDTIAPPMPGEVGLEVTEEV